MNKLEFMRQLKKELRRRNVNDIPEILADYEEHFAAAENEKTEQEIIEELGSVFQIANEYAVNITNVNNGVNNQNNGVNSQKIVYKKEPEAKIGLFVLLIVFDVIFGIAIASIIFSLVAALVAVSLSCIVGGGIWTVYSFFIFGAFQIKLAGFFAALAVMFLGGLGAFTIKPAIKGVIHLGKQYVRLHGKALGGKV